MIMELQHTSRNGTTQTITITGSTASAGATFGSQTYHVRLAANTAVQYKIGDGAQTAAQDATSVFLAANTIEYVRVSPGQTIAAIEAATNGLVTATSGTLWVTELTA